MISLDHVVCSLVQAALRIAIAVKVPGFVTYHLKGSSYKAKDALVRFYTSDRSFSFAASPMQYELIAQETPIKLVK